MITVFLFCSNRPVTEQEGQKFAKECGACGYIECSALTQKNLKDVFDYAVVEALETHNRKHKKKARSWKKRILQDSTKRTASKNMHSTSRNASFTWRKFLCFS